MFSSTFTPVISVVLSILLIVFYVKPAFGEVMHLHSEVQGYEDAKKTYVDYEAKVRSLVSVRDSTKLTDRKALEAMIPETFDVTRALLDLESLIKKSGMLFGNVTVNERAAARAQTDEEAGEPVDSGSEFHETSISFAVIGSYAQLKDALQLLESSLVLMEITNLEIGSIGESGLGQFQITVRMYSEK